MEYEIEDDEALFDESTNPSLEHGARREKGSGRRSTSRPNSAAEKDKGQKAVHIPEEEPETQMA